MTAVVGIKCRDGVVIGTDSSATLGDGDSYTVEQPTKKLWVIGDHVILAGTGEVGLGQRFHRIVKEQWEKKLFSSAADEFAVVKELSRLAIEDFQYTHIKTAKYGALVAFPFNGRFHLCEFALGNFQPEFKDDALWYVSMGCTQKITDAFLGFVREVFWSDKRPPTLQDGRFAATWTLQQAIDLNAGGVKGPVQMAQLAPGEKRRLSARFLEVAELDHHRQSIKAAVEHLREFPKMCEATPKEVPELEPELEPAVKP